MRALAAAAGVGLDLLDVTVTKIMLQLSTQKGLGSAVIRYFTWSDFSHVDFVLPDGNLLGARMDGGVQVRPPNYGAFTKKLILTIEVSDVIGKKILGYALKQIGKPYDRSGIVNFFNPQRRDWAEDDSWFCSELVAASFEKGGYPLFNRTNADRITPRDLTVTPYLQNQPMAASV